MAKLPAPKKASASGQMAGAKPGSTGMSMDKTTPTSEAYGKFDKFGLFALLVPSVLLVITGLVLGIAYTFKHYDVGLLGIFPGAKRAASFDKGGAESIMANGAPIDVSVVGFESTNYIGRAAAGEYDVAVLNVGSQNNVNIGDVFTVDGLAEKVKNVRLEFVVFDTGPSVSRAYILLGEDSSATNGKRAYSLSKNKIVELCSGEKDIKVSRNWKDQIVRRYVEPRSIKQ